MSDQHLSRPTHTKPTMKKPARYIKHSNLPPSLGLNTALLWWIACDHFEAPGWVRGALVTLYGLLALYFLARVWTETGVDLLNNDD